ncbi:MAG: hypothetical protein IJO11_03345 [Alphaproteobacteria bacterium]|nr:hypothetical protein [Alphaproteobacteria bacterium]
MQIKLYETGRSMVEMLGVLAIIGVLSVAGVATYQYALTAYQAGKVQDVLGKAKTLAQTDSRASHALEVNRFIKSALPEYVPDDKKSMVKLIDGNYQVTAFKVVYKVCEKLLQKERILNDIGISVLTRTCGNPNSKTNMVFSFNSTPTFESGSHFGGESSGENDGNGGNSGNSGSDMPNDNPNIEPQSCPDKMAWRQKEDGTYGCVCRHAFEYGDNCERCEYPREWKNDSCQCPVLTPYYDGEKCITCTEATGGAQPYFDNGVCVGGRFCLSFDATADKNTCMTCDDTTGQLLEKPNGEVCSIKGLEGTCINGECLIPCDTQDDCGGIHSDFYCHYEFDEPVYGIVCRTPLNPADRKRYCVSKERATQSISSTAADSIKQYKISKEKMNWYDAENYCKAWGMRMPSYADFGCSFYPRGTCATAPIIELGQTFGSNYIWINQNDGRCQHMQFQMGNGVMDKSVYGALSCFALCITDNSIEKTENACTSTITSDCQICNPETQETTFLPNGDECALDTGGKGICQDGVCILAGQGCNENTDCNTGEYCRYTTWDISTHSPIINEATGYKGVCRIAVKEQKASDKPVETSVEELDWYSANNFCQALGLTQIQSWFCGVDRFCSNTYFSNFTNNFGQSLFWCGPNCAVSYGSYVSPSIWADNTAKPYCY